MLILANLGDPRSFGRRVRIRTVFCHAVEVKLVKALAKTLLLQFLTSCDFV